MYIARRPRQSATQLISKCWAGWVGQQFFSRAHRAAGNRYAHNAATGIHLLIPGATGRIKTSIGFVTARGASLGSAELPNQISDPVARFKLAAGFIANTDAPYQTVSCTLKGFG